ncbi:MAG: hypothetical protein AAGF93_08140, partial [Cyanobacteria bacterium P01_H01_bin.105]
QKTWPSLNSSGNALTNYPSGMLLLFRLNRDLIHLLFPYGFYWIDHQANTFNVVLSNTWDAAEYQLQQRGVVFSNYESS